MRDWIKMEKLKWCLNQKNGIELVEPNENLSRAYSKDSDDDLIAMEATNGKWKIVTAYYACYHAFYSLLQKAGIRCEIHDCTLELMKFFDFNTDDLLFMQRLKSDRVAVQYYLEKNKPLDSSKIKAFILKCKNLSRNLTEDKIKHIRSKVKND